MMLTRRLLSRSSLIPFQYTRSRVPTRFFTTPTVTPITSIPKSTPTPIPTSTSTSASATPSPSPSPRKPKHHWFRNLFATFALANLVTGIYIYTNKDLHERFTRAKTFWLRVFPIYLHYRYVEWRTKGKSDSEIDAELEKLHEKYAPICLDLLLELRGFYIKLGQVGSTRNDFLPKAYLDRVTTLQDGVPPESGEYARKAIEKSLGKPIDELFSYFNDEAIGAASISQVHEARLHDGTEVVVKVQYERTKRLFELDLATVRAFCKLAQPAHLSMLDEIQKQFMTEFDFEREAAHLSAIRENMREPFPEVVIPYPIPGMVSKDVLVMERLHGIKLVDGLKKQMKIMAEKEGKTMDELRAEFEEKAKNITLDTAKPSAFTITLYQWALKTRNWTVNILASLYNITLGWILPPIKPAPVMVPINHVAILDLLLRVHGHQILVNGLFNGDPHPGNVLLLDNGKLGLIDYGQVKAIPHSSRIEIARLITYLVNDDKSRIVQQIVKMGMKTKYMKPKILEKHAQILMNRDDREVCEGLNLQLFLEKLDAEDPTISIPDEYLMAARVSILLRGLGTILMYPHATTTYWYPIAQRVLREEGIVVESSPSPLPVAVSPLAS